MDLKHKLTKIRMPWTHFIRQKREGGGGGGGLNANILLYLNILYTTAADICVKIAYYVNK